MDGEQLVLAIRERFPDVAAFVWSVGGVGQALARRLKAAGAEAAFDKLDRDAFWRFIEFARLRGSLLAHGRPYRPERAGAMLQEMMHQAMGPGEPTVMAVALGRSDRRPVPVTDALIAQVGAGYALALVREHDSGEPLLVQLTLRGGAPADEEEAAPAGQAATEPAARSSAISMTTSRELSRGRRLRSALAQGLERLRNTLFFRGHVYALDYDGTLAYRERAMHPDVARAVARLLLRGDRVILLSAKSRLEMLRKGFHVVQQVREALLEEAEARRLKMTGRGAHRIMARGLEAYFDHAATRYTVGEHDWELDEVYSHGFDPNHPLLMLDLLQEGGWWRPESEHRSYGEYFRGDWWTTKFSFRPFGDRPTPHAERQAIADDTVRLFLGRGIPVTGIASGQTSIDYRPALRVRGGSLQTIDKPRAVRHLRDRGFRRITFVGNERLGGDRTVFEMPAPKGLSLRRVSVDPALPPGAADAFGVEHLGGGPEGTLIFLLRELSQPPISDIKLSTISDIAVGSATLRPRLATGLPFRDSHSEW